MKKTLLLTLLSIFMCACAPDNWIIDPEGTGTGTGSGSSGGGNFTDKKYDTGDEIHWALYKEGPWAYKQNAFQFHIGGGAFQVLVEEDYNYYRSGSDINIDDPYREGGKKYAKCKFYVYENKYTKQGTLVYKEKRYTDEFIIDVTALENGKLKLTRDSYSYSPNSKVDISEDPFAN